jgi:hypothetical protein
VPPGKEDVAMASGAVLVPAFTVNESALLAVWIVLELSVTLAVKGKVPELLVVPEIVPPELIVNPEGNPVADHLYGVVPPLATKVTL